MEYLIENEYIKVLQCFRDSDKKIQIEKLRTLTYLVEDRELKDKINRFVEIAKELPEDISLVNYKNVESPEKITEVLKRKRELQKYIEDIINGDKPYWQVIAEQRGWLSPEIIPKRTE